MDDVLSDSDFIERAYEHFLLRPSDAAGHTHYLALLASGAPRLDVVRALATSQEFFELLCRQRFGTQTGSPFLSAVPPGHFYSPIPAAEAVETLQAQPESFDPSCCPGIDLRVDDQLALLSTLAAYAGDLQMPDRPDGSARYIADNGSFAPGDAVLLATLMRHTRPSRILEIGAGYSTAAMLDVAEHHLHGRIKIEAVDPEPQRVRALLRDGDDDRLVLHEGLVQDLPLALFTTLGPNDILFIDSSHVMKLGSDVAYLMLEVLPILAPGVLVHFHDIAWPFEYPVDLYRAGWAWNEAYAVRLLLANSRHYEILLFADYLVRAKRDEVRQRFPAALRQRPGVPPEGNSACSLWLRRC